MHLPAACLVLALAIAGSYDEAMAAANGLIDAAEATHNPFALLYYAFRHAAWPSSTPIPTGHVEAHSGAC